MRKLMLERSFSLYFEFTLKYTIDDRRITKVFESCFHVDLSNFVPSSSFENVQNVFSSCCGSRLNLKSMNMKKDQ